MKMIGSFGIIIIILQKAQNTPIPDINDFAKRWLEAYGKTGDIEKSRKEAMK